MTADVPIVCSMLMCDATVYCVGDSVLESLRCVQKRTLSRPPTPGTRPVTPVSEEDGEEDENTGEGEDKEPGENGENGEGMYIYKQVLFLR